MVGIKGRRTRLHLAKHVQDALRLHRYLSNRGIDALVKNSLLFTCEPLCAIDEFRGLVEAFEKLHNPNCR